MKYSTTDLDVLLVNHGLKKTQLRRVLLAELLATQSPLTQADLLTRLNERNEAFDRVSVYRNLLQMKERGLVHEVSVNHYVACEHKCEKHPHVLLYCQTCERHQEIKDHHRIQGLIKAVSGFKFFSDDQPLFIRGVCDTCTIEPSTATV